MYIYIYIYIYIYVYIYVARLMNSNVTLFVNVKEFRLRNESSVRGYSGSGTGSS